MKILEALWLVLLFTLIPAGFGDEAKEASELNKSLLQAAAGGDVDRAKSVLSKGADVNAKNKNGRTPLS